MRHFARFMLAATLFAFAILVFVPKGQAIGTTNLAVEFDGGFVFLFAEDSKNIEVLGAKTHSTIMDHRLRLGIPADARYDRSATTLTPAPRGQYLTWDLSGYDASIEPGGQPLATRPITIPKSTKVNGCANVEGADANNLKYFVNLHELYPSSTINRDGIAARLNLTDGEFYVRRAGYCWQFETQTGEKRARQSMVQGIRSMGYRLATSHRYVDIRLTARDGVGAPQRIRLLPGENGSVLARVSTTFQGMSDDVKAGEFDEHYRIFYSLLSPAVDESKQLMPRLMSDKRPTSPGDFCPTGAYWIGR